MVKFRNCSICGPLLTLSKLLWPSGKSVAHTCSKLRRGLYVETGLFLTLAIVQRHIYIMSSSSCEDQSFSNQNELSCTLVASVCVRCPLTHNESLCVRELLEEFPEVLIALLVCWAQHLQ